MKTNNAKSGIIHWILIIVAAGLLVFICWKAGWILTGNRNDVSQQEKQEAIQEATDELNATIREEQPTINEAESDLQEAQEDLQEAASELRDALK